MIFQKRKSCSKKSWLTTKYCSRKCSHSAKIGKPLFTEEQLKERSKKTSGKNNPFYGKKHTKEAKEKISRSFMKTISERYAEIYGKVGEANTGKKSHKWKGDKAGSRAIHLWVCRQKGKASLYKCKCGEEAKHWSNIDHKYKRILKDYTAMCVKCHLEFDRKNNNKNCGITPLTS